MLGLDTGLANLGYTVARVTGPRAQDLVILEMGLFTTKKTDTKKRNVRAADDSFERGRAQARRLREVVLKWRPDLVTYEAMSFVRNASSMAKIGMSFGIVTALLEEIDVPALSANPSEIKQALGVSTKKNTKKPDVEEDGKTSDTKLRVQQALDVMFQNCPKQFLDAQRLKQDSREHPYDSLGSIVACWDSDIMRMVRAQVVKRSA